MATNDAKPGNLPQALESAGFVGTPTYNVGPGQTPIPFPTADGRHHALTILRKYLSLLTFRKGDGRGGATEFSIPENRVFFEWPDYEQGFLMPAIAIMPAPPDAVTADFIGNVPYIKPGSEDIAGPGTALYEWAEHFEMLTFHVWAKDRAERRALIAGLQIALNPQEEVSGVRFKMTDYFGQICEFSYEGGGRVEDDDASKNRRRAELKVTIRFNSAYVANAQDFYPEMAIDVFSADDPTGNT